MTRGAPAGGGSAFGAWVARWWAHRKLGRNQCDGCGKPLPDTGSPVPGYRACSEECADLLWAQRTS